MIWALNSIILFLYDKIKVIFPGSFIISLFLISIILFSSLQEESISIFVLLFNKQSVVSVSNISFAGIILLNISLGENVKLMFSPNSISSG